MQNNLDEKLRQLQSKDATAASQCFSSSQPLMAPYQACDGNLSNMRFQNVFIDTCLGP